MPGRYKQSQDKNKSRFYILLSVIFVVVMFKWGIPMFMNLVAGNGATRVNTGKDIIPPQSPIISALPDATNSALLAIDGFTEKNAFVDLLVNDLVEKTDTADVNGAFTFDGNLTLGLNRIQLRAKDAAGNESMSEVTLVTYDNKPLILTISSPKDGSEYFGKVNQVIDIKGEISKPSGQVMINNSFVTVDKTGQFVHRFMLSGGDNNIKIVASDKAGNIAEQGLKLVYTP